MACTLNVEIDIPQREFMQKNRFKLAIAKVVNGVSTVVWHSSDVLLTNQFTWSQDYTVWATINYETGMQVEEWSNSVPIQFGQTAIIDEAGVIQPATGRTGGNSFKIKNNYQPIHVGVSCAFTSGKNQGNQQTKCYVSPYKSLYKGVNTLTPIEKVQVWFDYETRSESMIDADAGVGFLVDFTEQKTHTISYVSRDAQKPDFGGEWIHGPISSVPAGKPLSTKGQYPRRMELTISQFN